MTKVIVKWYEPFIPKQISREKKFQEFDGIYMIIDREYNYSNERWGYRNDILYIGMTYHQSFQQEINQTLNRKNIQKCLKKNLRINY